MCGDFLRGYWYNGTVIQRFWYGFMYSFVMVEMSLDMSLEHHARVCHGHHFCSLLVTLNRLVFLCTLMVYDGRYVKCSLKITSFVYTFILSKNHGESFFF